MKRAAKPLCGHAFPSSKGQVVFAISLLAILFAIGISVTSFFPAIPDPILGSFLARRQLQASTAFGFRSQEEKLDLVGQALASQAFEAHVSKFPVLADLFAYFEKNKQRFEIHFE